jgi:lysophospholipase L1-like esterase
MRIAQVLVLSVLLGLGTGACQLRRSERAADTRSPGGNPNSQAKLATAPAEAQVTKPVPPKATSQGDIEPKGRLYKVAALGDSITDERVGGGGYLAYLRKACPKSSFHHFGKGGDMTNQMRRRLLTDLLPEQRTLKLDTLIVLGGVNDLYSNISAQRTNQRIEEDLLSIYQSAHQSSLRVIAITVLPWGGFTKYFSPERSQNTRALNSFILGLESRGQVDIVIDGYALLGCDPPERLCPAYERTRPDGLHPGPLGHEVLGQALKAQAFADCL